MYAPEFQHTDPYVARYHYLCRRAARKFVRPGLERSDLEQVAAIGLLKASRRYEASSNIPFEAYAWILILGELMHFTRDYEHLVRIPRGVRALERKYWEAFERLAARHGREPSDDEIADALGTRPALVSAAKIARWVANPASIEHAGLREQAVSVRLEGDHGLSVTERIVLEDALAALAPAERSIVLSHYVFGQTQEQIAAKLGLSKRQVSRLQYRALERMRGHLAGAS
jgi:RNA polymerase sigma factor (sigma-70 family)